MGGNYRPRSPKEKLKNIDPYHIRPSATSTVPSEPNPPLKAVASFGDIIRTQEERSYYDNHFLVRAPTWVVLSFLAIRILACAGISIAFSYLIEYHLESEFLSLVDWWEENILAGCIATIIIYAILTLTWLPFYIFTFFLPLISFFWIFDAVWVGAVVTVVTAVLGQILGTVMIVGFRRFFKYFCRPHQRDHFFAAHDLSPNQNFDRRLATISVLRCAERHYGFHIVATLFHAHIFYYQDLVAMLLRAKVPLWQLVAAAALGTLPHHAPDLALGASAGFLLSAACGGGCGRLGLDRGATWGAGASAVPVGAAVAVLVALTTLLRYLARQRVARLVRLSLVRAAWSTALNRGRMRNASARGGGGRSARGGGGGGGSGGDPRLSEGLTDEVGTVFAPQDDTELDLALGLAPDNLALDSSGSSRGGGGGLPVRREGELYFEEEEEEGVPVGGRETMITPFSPLPSPGMSPRPGGDKAGASFAGGDDVTPKKLVGAGAGARAGAGAGGKVGGGAGPVEEPEEGAVLRAAGAATAELLAAWDAFALHP